MLFITLSQSVDGRPMWSPNIVQLASNDTDAAFLKSHSDPLPLPHTSILSLFSIYSFGPIQ